MDPTLGYFSIIQYMPDAARCEGVNVGVVLFDPRAGRLCCRTYPGVERVERLFGAVDRKVFSMMRRAAVDNILRSEVADRPAFDALIASFGNEIHLTPARAVMLEHPTAAQVGDLFTKLVLA